MGEQSRAAAAEIERRRLGREIAVPADDEPRLPGKTIEVSAAFGELHTPRRDFSAASPRSHAMLQATRHALVCMFVTANSAPSGQQHRLANILPSDAAVELAIKIVQ